ncbi:ABC transporter substrate-binding protein [Microbacterium sp. A588]
MSGLLLMGSSRIWNTADRDLVPALAESWETADDGLTWDFHLRYDEVFSNGDTFDARTTLDYFRAEGSTVRRDLALVDEVIGIDSVTLRAVTTKPNSGLPDGRYWGVQRLAAARAVGVPRTVAWTRW